MTSIKTAIVNVRIQENVKVEAEAILKKLDLTRATVIDLFYRQIIMHNGIPFLLEIKKDAAIDKKMISKK
ncbi:type II toxin-antitoxin system RelB/DinJ family antitoxin [Gemella sp. 20925_1_85]|uniref:type II toxin-antitoxin system RelB/DinJ family antitoxin n=1 Tax=Gemella sp. 20925_1_85 TaxID=3003690 RepID=UPI00352E464F